MESGGVAEVLLRKERRGVRMPFVFIFLGKLGSRQGAFLSDILCIWIYKTKVCI